MLTKVEGEEEGKEVEVEVIEKEDDTEKEEVANQQVDVGEVHEELKVEDDEEQKVV